MSTATEKKKSTRKPKAKKATFSKEDYLSWYELMLRIRRFEEMALRMYGQQKIRGFCHVYIGQEAVAAGIESAIRPEDKVVTVYNGVSEGYHCEGKKFEPGYQYVLYVGNKRTHKIQCSLDHPAL